MDKLEKLRRAREKDEAKQRELERKQQSRLAQITKLERSQDTHRKVLMGTWAGYAAEKSPEFRERMLRELDEIWLWRDDERPLFGFPLLPEEEKARRRAIHEQNRQSRKAAVAPPDKLTPADDALAPMQEDA